MIDFNDLEKRPEIYKMAVQTKNSKVDIDLLIDISKKRQELLTQLEKLRAESNNLATQIKQLTRDKQLPKQEQLEWGRTLKDNIKILEVDYSSIDKEYSTLLSMVPNLPSHDTPIGKDDSENVVLRTWGEIRDFAKEGFQPKEHWQLGIDLDLIDTERATKVSGSRFAYLKGALVKMQFAIMQMTLSKLSDPHFIEEAISYAGLDLPNRPFTAVIPPVIINPEPFARMARLEPREERYHITGDNQYLVGSAEHTLGAMYMDETILEEKLPIRMLGYSTSFRREAGSYGKDTKGILRLHQFDKLEMEVFSTPETGLAEQDLLVAIQEKLMQLLNLPYQVIICCTGDQGDPDARHIDINTWLPGQNRYRETHSADYMTDYQSRRLNTKFKRKSGQKSSGEPTKPELIHMNDATAFAIGRILIAIMENYQTRDGNIAVPDVLQDYTGFSVINRDS